MFAGPMLTQLKSIRLHDKLNSTSCCEAQHLLHKQMSYSPKRKLIIHATDELSVVVFSMVIELKQEVWRLAFLSCLLHTSVFLGGFRLSGVLNLGLN